MTTPIQRWLDTVRRSCDMQVREIPRSQSKEWIFDGHRLHHTSGGFFSVVGAALYAKGARQAHLDQPLIDQPEIGILAFLIKTVHDTVHFLVQAKPEPGNIALVQAAPSVQATESNYKRRHKGKAIPFLEYCLVPGKATILSDTLQSEQGTRFLGKYNRNMVVEVAGDEPRPESPGLKWFPIHDLYPLLLEDFQINTDARSVLASAPWRLFNPGRAPFGQWRGRGGPGEAFLRSFEAPEDRSALSTTRIIERLRQLRTTAEVAATVVGLTDLTGWEMTDSAIRPERREMFAVRQFAVETSEREVASWDQPLIAAPVEGQAFLFCQERAGILHFLFNARAEIGFQETFQYGPTIQDLGDQPPILPSLEEQESALKHVLGRSDTLLSSMHSDEGGRFFRCVSRYGIRLLPPGESIEVGDNLSWMTLRQIEWLIRRPGFFSNEARSLISMVLAYL
jgi:oxidase EvaA